MASPLNIALVEDNEDLKDLLMREITKAGYGVLGAECAEDLDDLAATNVFDLLILDLNLPGENGLSIAQRYKQSNPTIFIIMLTARVGIEDKVIGYDAGADIYLTKPVSSSELMAAIGSITRRITNQLLDFPVTLNLRALRLEGRKIVDLNRQELVILKSLSESLNGNLPYYRLIELCGEEVNETSKATLEVRMVRLRKKLLNAGLESGGIRALRGEGYQLLAKIKVTT